ncbi:SUR7 family protein [Yarrowia sp. C11]|nr:SUR7 family protein [Yarrowia sp. C11]KAG5364662.1 SUR7 family protein [Yarrowia sp. E02]
MVLRPLFGATSILLIAGATLLSFFVLLAGARDSAPLNNFYWMEASTSSIPGAPDTTRWTTYNYCGVADGKNADCSPNKADFPFDPVRNFGTEEGVPEEFIGTNKWYYLTRFAWPFYIISLFFTVLTLFVSVFSLCSRLGSALALTLNGVSVFFWTIASGLSTACFAQAKGHFSDAKLGTKMFAFIWTTEFILLLTLFFFGFACCAGKKSSKNFAQQHEICRRDDDARSDCKTT